MYMYVVYKSICSHLKDFLISHPFIIIVNIIIIIIIIKC